VLVYIGDLNLSTDTVKTLQKIGVMTVSLYSSHRENKHLDNTNF